MTGRVSALLLALVACGSAGAGVADGGSAGDSSGDATHGGADAPGSADGAGGADAHAGDATGSGDAGAGDAQASGGDAGGEAGATSACGTTTCGPTQICMHPCCGLAGTSVVCSPPNDAGTCTQGRPVTDFCGPGLRCASPDCEPSSAPQCVDAPTSCVSCAYAQAHVNGICPTCTTDSCLFYEMDQQCVCF
jgi:hypothetical protein